MNVTPDPHDAASVTASGELAQLQGQVESMRSLLIRLLQEVVRSESRLDSSHAAQLLEANEQLVVTALRAQTDAVTTAFALDDASQSAQLDALTQLPNRALLRDRLGHAIASAGRHGARLALLFVDLDNFKQINDTLGHAVGDEVLKGVAHCLASSVRAADTVGRYGGDEFLILLAEVSKPSAAGLIAEKVIAAIGDLGHVSAQGAPLTASVGISIYPDDGEDAATLVARADAAMYRAKRHRPGAFAFHGQVPAGEQSPASPPESTARGATPAELALAEQESRNAQLREANEQLVLATLSARELQAAAEQAQRRQAALMASVVNELRNPQAPIRIATAMLGRGRTDEPLLPRVQAIVEQQVAQVSRLVGDLLDAAGSTTAALTLERSRVDMVRLARDVVEACRPAMDKRLQKLKLQLPASAIEVDGDPQRLAQLLGNLFDNASRFTPEGGEIELAITEVGDAVVMMVSDEGIGITAQALPTIFEPFAQDSHGIGLNGIGQGLGLTAVRAVVEAHGGTVAASSAGSGLGSRFVVTLPRAGRGPAQISAAAFPAASSTGSQTGENGGA